MHLHTNGRYESTVKIFRLNFLDLNFYVCMYVGLNPQVGDKLPSVDLFEDSPANKINTADLTSNKKVIVFAVPGAFTPGCSKVCTHIHPYSCIRLFY